MSCIREAFHIPDGVIYLDGNSLGPLPHVVRDRISQTINAHWGEMLIRGWNDADWINLPERVGAKIAQLIGAPQESVVACDSTSVNVHKCVSAALAMRPDRNVVLSDTGNFPTDLYVAEGLLRQLNKGPELLLADPESVLAAIDDTVALVMLTQVDYRTGRLHDMAAITAAAHHHGALVMWDLAHSAGALPVDLSGCRADFAVGCGYKYLNGGPGAPAFIFVRPDHAEHLDPALSGWLGHAAPFDFDLGYAPAPGVGRMRVGTPPILSMAALDAALDLWDDIDIHQVRARSIALCDQFIDQVETIAPDGALRLASPRDGSQRGSQISFHCEEGYAVMQALIARGVIGDFRAPDIIRFGIAPLYTTEQDIKEAAETLGDVLCNRLWDTQEYKTRAAVT
ncbi:MAG: kynureninase [Pseudomonadota bacterium]